MATSGTTAFDLSIDGLLKEPMLDGTQIRTGYELSAAEII